jgi:hypothetical protein
MREMVAAGGRSRNLSATAHAGSSLRSEWKNKKVKAKAKNKRKKCKGRSKSKFCTG